MKETAVKALELPLWQALRLDVGPNPYLSEDRKEGIAAYSKRAPNWTGAERQVTWAGALRDPGGTDRVRHVTRTGPGDLSSRQFRWTRMPADPTRKAGA